MKQKLFFLTTLILSLWSQGQTLDQSNVSSPNGGQLITNPNYIHLGQSFTNGLTGDLSRISVNIPVNPVYPTLQGDFDLIIYNGEGLSGTILRTHTFSVINNFAGELIINFLPVAVTTGQVTTFKIAPTNTSSTGRILLETTNNTYSGGIYYNGIFGPDTNNDLLFKTFVTLPALGTHLNFDGVNDRVELPNESLYDFTTAMTVEVWMNSSVIPEQWDPLISKGDDSWRLHLNDNGTLVFSCNVGSPSSTDAISSTVITDGNWHHVAGTFDGAFLKLYIDGVLESQVAASGSIINSSFPVYIGNNSDYLVRFFNGNIDDVRIWNLARTVEQINGSKNCELQGTESGLVSYFNFNQGIDSGDNTSLTTAFCGLASNVGNLQGFSLTGSTSNWKAGSPVTTGSIIPSNATVMTPVTYTQGDTTTQLTATTGTNGTGLLWYQTATGNIGTTTAFTPTTSTVGSTSYWVSSTNANGCESARTEIVVTVNPSISGCWKNIYTGANQTYAIGNDGTLWSWGFNAESQLGLGDTSSRFTPTQIGTATNWKTLSSGDRHVLALREDGTLWVWGRNTQGHLGLGDTSQRNAPIQLGTATDWDKIDCGANTSLAIKTDGTLWVWGGNNEGQLGLGDLTQRLVPTQIGTDTDWIAINGAGQSTYAIKSNGTLWGTGANTDGQLGLGNNTQRLSFVQIGTDTNWSKVHVGFGAFALAQKLDGSLWGTGNNQFGQLGQNNTANLNVFTQVGTATDWNKFTTASSHSMAIKNDGTLYTWGRNNSGQLGLGDNSNRLVPTQVGSATNWYDVSAGDGFLLALNIVGEIWVTGNNWAGQLGLGDTTNRNVLVQITCPSVLGTDDFITENKVTIYPNPSNGIFTIVSEADSAVEVYDMIGKKVLSKNVSIGTSNLDLTNYANGIYLITVGNQNGSLSTYKIIKQ